MAKPRRIAGAVDGDVQGARVLIVEARYYDDISELLLDGATRALGRAGATHDRVIVPGALEIPPAMAITLESAEHRGRPYDGAVALGCVIRGETSHYDIVAGESARALMELAVSWRLPVGNGILTVDTETQARMRASVDGGDKGGAAVEAALTLIRLKRRGVAQELRDNAGFVRF